MSLILLLNTNLDLVIKKILRNLRNLFSSVLMVGGGGYLHILNLKAPISMLADI